jgi:dTDP-4-amino-4,6-dideoxygalactose transaminase
MNELGFLERALNVADASGKSTLVSEYEAALCAYFDSPYAVALNSGSAAIEATLIALGARPGTTVAVSAAAPLPTLMPIVATGADLLFVDSAQDQVSLEVGDLRSSFSDRVVAVVEAPLWGYPQDYSELREFLSSRGVPLVIDAAHAHGAFNEGKCVGMEGAVGCFSTHQMKMLSTGEGGFVVTADAELSERIRKYSRIGALDGESMGRNFKPSAFTAAVGLSRIAHLNDAVAWRRQTAREILTLLPEELHSELSHPGTPNGYNLVIDTRRHSPKRVTSFVNHLARLGIKSDTIRFRYRVGYDRALTNRWKRNCPNAEALIARLVQLPTSGVEPSEVADTVRTAWRASK